MALHSGTSYAVSYGESSAYLGVRRDFPQEGNEEQGVFGDAPCSLLRPTLVYAVESEGDEVHEDEVSPESDVEGKRKHSA